MTNKQRQPYDKPQLTIYPPLVDTTGILVTIVAAPKRTSGDGSAQIGRAKK